MGFRLRKLPHFIIVIAFAFEVLYIGTNLVLGPAKDLTV